jgi:hypothetical protein
MALLQPSQSRPRNLGVAISDLTGVDRGGCMTEKSQFDTETCQFETENSQF